MLTSGSRGPAGEPMLPPTMLITVPLQPWSYMCWWAVWLQHDIAYFTLAFGSGCCSLVWLGLPPTFRSPTNTIPQVPCKPAPPGPQSTKVSGQWDKAQRNPYVNIFVEPVQWFITLILYPLCWHSIWVPAHFPDTALPQNSPFAAWENSKGW